MAAPARTRVAAPARATPGRTARDRQRPTRDRRPTRAPTTDAGTDTGGSPVSEREAIAAFCDAFAACYEEPGYPIESCPDEIASYLGEMLSYYGAACVDAYVAFLGCIGRHGCTPYEYNGEEYGILNYEACLAEYAEYDSLCDGGDSLVFLPGFVVEACEKMEACDPRYTAEECQEDVGDTLGYLRDEYGPDCYGAYLDYLQCLSVFGECVEEGYDGESYMVLGSPECDDEYVGYVIDCDAD